MRIFFQSILTLLLFSSALNAQEIKFKDTKFNFGFVHEGDVVKMEYELENTGNEPLVISDYKVECGCMVLEKPSNPILSHEKYILKVTFDTANKYDRQDRTITVISNAKNSPTELRFKGVVLKPKKKN